MPGASVVALEDDLFLVPAKAGEQIAHPGNHEIQSADVAVNIEAKVSGWDGGIDRRCWQRLAHAGGPLFNDFCDVDLNVAPQACPGIESAAQGGQVVEVGHALRERLELLLVIDVGLMAGAVNEKDLFAFAAVGTIGREKPLQIGAHGRHARAGGDEDGVGNGVLQYEVAVRAVYLDRGANREVGQIGQMIGKEAVFYAIDAKLKAVSDGRRSDGISARLLLTVLILCHSGDELSGLVWKIFDALDLKQEVVALGNF